MPDLLSAVRAHIHAVLGVSTPAPRPWARGEQLPYFLRDALQFRELEFLGQPIVLATLRDDRQHSLAEVRTWLSSIRDQSGQQVVYVAEALASYERRRLIEHHVPFIVPGNQLYLPQLGMDLREHFRQRTPTVQALSPSAQAILISALLRRPWEPQWRPSTLAADLGYTPMTLSRATRELTAAGLASLQVEGRSRWLNMAGTPEEVWERARPALRTPVRHVAWVAGQRQLTKVPRRLAGLSALAHGTMMGEPPWPVYAVSSQDWKNATHAGVREIPEPVAGAQEWQVWSYSPALVPDTPTVDPLSLTLTFAESADDRIQLALDELKRQLPW